MSSGLRLLQRPPRDKAGNLLASSGARVEVNNDPRARLEFSFIDHVVEDAMAVLSREPAAKTPASTSIDKISREKDHHPSTSARTPEGGICSNPNGGHIASDSLSSIVASSIPVAVNDFPRVTFEVLSGATTGPTQSHNSKEDDSHKDNSNINISFGTGIGLDIIENSDTTSQPSQLNSPSQGFNPAVRSPNRLSKYCRLPTGGSTPSPSPPASPASFSLSKDCNQHPHDPFNPSSAANEKTHTAQSLLSSCSVAPKGSCLMAIQYNDCKDVDSVIAPFLAIKFKNDAYAVKNSRLIANKEWLNVVGMPSNREPEQDADLGGYACDAVMSQARALEVYQNNKINETKAYRARIANLIKQIQ